MPKLHTKLHHVMLSACSDTSVISAAQMKTMFKLGLLAIRQTAQVAPKVSKLWKPSDWSGLSVQLAASKRFQASDVLQKMCQQMIEEASNDPGAKRQAVPSPTKRKANGNSGEELDEEVLSKPSKRKRKEKA